VALEEDAYRQTLAGAKQTASTTIGKPDQRVDRVVVGTGPYGVRMTCSLSSGYRSCPQSHINYLLTLESGAAVGPKDAILTRTPPLVSGVCQAQGLKADGGMAGSSCSVGTWRRTRPVPTEYLQVVLLCSVV
jgi:hypothetical protein